LYNFSQENLKKNLQVKNIMAQAKAQAKAQSELELKLGQAPT
jgi:hypothetical protein